jgi:hypothetical protein
MVAVSQECIMSKFAKPKPTKDDIDRVIGGAEAKDGQAEAVPEKETRFTMVLQPALTRQIDAARKKAGGLSRLSWIRMVIVERLARDEDR